MAKSTKILLGLMIFIIALTLGLVGWSLLNKKTPLKIPILTLPTANKVGTSNTPSGLVGPQEETRATTLSTDKIIELTNKYRAANNLPPLTQNTLLTSAADTRTNDMFQKQYFDHVSPNGTTPSDVVLKTGYDYSVSGENIALGDFTSEQDLVDAWYASPGHRANILNPQYSQIGVSAQINDYQGRHTWIATQEFGKPAPKCNLPDQNLSNTIDQDKTQYGNLAAQMNDLSQKTQDLTDQSNQKTTQGNSVFSQTASKSKAQPYWNEGKSLAKEADQDLAQAKSIDAQLKTLYSQIDELISKYNAEVSSYNNCIKQ
jgi:uncharacterized protein YkwD